MPILYQARNAETCGDANNAVLWVKYWLPPAKSHLVWDSAHFTKSALNVGGIADYTYVGDAFYAFQTQETGTVPLWFFSKLQGDDFMIATGNADGSTPSPPAGFAVSFVLGYAYPSQICDSVPLFVVYDSTTTDHYFTIDPREKQGFLAVGYVDQGIVAYVLPLDDGKSCFNLKFKDIS